MRARTAFAGAAFQQLLRLRAAPLAGAQVSSGALSNMIVADAKALEEFFTYWHFTWHGLVELVAICATALAVAGVPALAGVAIVVLVVAACQALAKRVGALRRHVIVATDARVRLTGEALGAARAVKMNGWVAPVVAKLRALRAKEAGPLTDAAMARAGNAAARDAAVPFASLATFGALAGAVGGAGLAPARVFTVLALFQALLRVLGIAPLGATAAQEARSGVERLRLFLCAHPSGVDDEIKPRAPLPEGSESAYDAALSVDKGAEPVDKAHIEPAELHGSWGWHARPPGGASKAEAAGDDADDDANADDAEAGGGCGGATLRELAFRARAGRLTAVVGPVGSGKSSLLLALLGELHARHDAGGPPPRRTLRGAVAYAPQEPWVQSASVRDNILMRASAAGAGSGLRWSPAAGAAADEGRYAEALDAAALGPDRASVPAGDATPVGERGVTLSGGQRARVSLARAVYSATARGSGAGAGAPFAVALLDDPLAAVDAATGSALMRRCVCGALRNATRILVTHQRQWLASCDDVAVLHGGRLVFLGPPGALLAHAPAGADVAVAARALSAAVASAATPQRALLPAPPSQQPPALDEVLRRSLDAASRDDLLLSKANAESAPAEDDSALAGEAPLPPPPPVALVLDEERNAGGVSWDAYKEYAKAAGGAPVLIGMLLAYVAQAAARVAVDLWLAWWADARFPNLGTEGHIGVFAALTAGAVVMSLARSAGLTAAALRAASVLHAQALGAVLRAPVSFFDATPAGRVLNRFSRDQAVMDAEIPTALQFAGELLAGTAAGACVCAALLPAFSACALPLAIAFRYAQRRYAPLSRDAKRLEAAARSPLLSAAVAAAAAAPALRAAGAAHAFAADFAAAQDAHNRAHWAFVAAGRWLGSRLDALAAGAVATAAACVAGSRGTIDPGLAGMALVSSLAFTGTLQYAVRQLSELENLFTSVERMIAYTRLESEAEACSAPGTLPLTWPSAGALDVQQLTVAYAPGAPPALRGVSLAVPAGTKLAVLGRTGSGKSTFAAALFRLVENSGCSGAVRIDGLDIRSIGLDDLRSRIALIPQEAVLFAGSLRDNLDPFGAASVLDVAALLPRLGLAGRAGGAGLDAPISEGGENLSAGERALVCLGRALLRRSRLLVCDEATAAVDAECDARIQTAIRADFAQCTVVTIAHRLATVIDADMVAVLVPGGTLAESGEPDELLRTAPDGPFAARVAATGPAHAATLAEAAKEAAQRRRSGRAARD